MKNIKSFEDFIAENNQVVNEEAINEASISSVSNKLEKTMLQMKKLVGTWKTEKDEAKKAKIKDQLKELTDKKKELEKDLNDAIEELDKNAQLVATDESTSTDYSIDEANSKQTGKFHGKTIKEIEHTKGKGGEQMIIIFEDGMKMTIEPGFAGGGKLSLDAWGK